MIGEKEVMEAIQEHAVEAWIKIWCTKIRQWSCIWSSDKADRNGWTGMIAREQRKDDFKIPGLHDQADVDDMNHLWFKRG